VVVSTLKMVTKIPTETLVPRTWNHRLKRLNLGIKIFFFIRFVWKIHVMFLPSRYQATHVLSRDRCIATL
jgi:hypothetical protein